MTIDTGGKWWIGSEAGDIEGFLRAYADDGTPISEFRLSRCKCSSESFTLDADDRDGCAKRTCTVCASEHLICDSAEYWDQATPERWQCIECGSEAANVGVGYSLYDDGEIRWLYVGERCLGCGILGCFAGWKIAYAPSRSLLEAA